MMCSTVEPSMTAPGSVSRDSSSLPRLEHDRMTAVQEHRGLEAGPSSEAWVHEDHGEHLALEPAGDTRLA
jgi:hypothetical protein